jgi:hypothetical protein
MIWNLKDVNHSKKGNYRLHKNYNIEKNQTEFKGMSLIQLIELIIIKINYKFVQIWVQSKSSPLIFLNSKEEFFESTAFMIKFIKWKTCYYNVNGNPALDKALILKV